ncbi:chorismate mutase [Paracoccus sp. NSM]|uniref:chorismate mutase n=1 Tax=Paracoccus sp. NSM TaxID=3457784 RepID=UPI0040373C03
MKPTDQIPDMQALRAEIDALDRDLVRLLARRRDLIDRAAQLKAVNGWPARIEARVEEVVANARSHATAAGLDADLIETIWRQLIEAAIAQEERQLERKEQP